MVLIKCERCSRKTAKAELCNFCNRHVCVRCIKASKRTRRRDLVKIVICKDCWTNTELRKKYRHNEVTYFI